MLKKQLRREQQRQHVLVRACQAGGAPSSGGSTPLICQREGCKIQSNLQLPSDSPQAGLLARKLMERMDK